MPDVVFQGLDWAYDPMALLHADTCVKVPTFQLPMRVENESLTDAAGRVVGRWN